jgi:tRNA-2-methylthio-N6-dimethylallyladenosine synthase
MYRNQPKVCEYVHLPFQSGSSRILNLMNRGYTREEYLQKIAMIRKAIPNAVLSTDIIVGFPGETEEDFLQTMSLVLEVGFETIFAFKYSPRPLTKAARFEGQLDEDTKSERLQRLFKAHDEWSKADAKKYEGMTLDILVEKYDEARGNLSGRSTQNKLTYFPGETSLIGQTVKVKINQAFPAVLRGELETH